MQYLDRSYFFQGTVENIHFTVIYNKEKTSNHPNEEAGITQ